MASTSARSAVARRLKHAAHLFRLSTLALRGLHRNITRTLLVAITTLILAAPAYAATFSCTYDGGSLNWGLASSWDGNGLCGGFFPNNGGGNNFNATVSTGTVTLDQNIIIDALTLSGGTITGSNNLTMGAASTWTDGTMSGTGTTIFNGSLTLSGNGLRDLTGGRTLNTTATTTWTNAAGGNAGRIRTGSGAVINNSGTWLDQTTLATSIANDFGGAASTFNNTGTYTKSGASTTTISIAFNNTSSGAGTGVVNVNAGTLALSGGGTSNGSFDVAAGATLDFGGGTYSLGGTVSGTGTGRLLVSGGIVNSSGSTTFGGQLAISGGTFNAGGTFTAAGFDMSGGILGGTGTAIITGAGTWTTGAMTGAGVTTFNGALALSGNGLRDITTRSVNFAGTSTWTNSAGGNAGRIRTGSGAVINNSGTWLDQTTLATSIANDFGGAASTFNNTGTYTKSGASTTTISIAFNNTSSGAGTGVVNVNAGTLALSGGGTSNGSFDVAAGATLDFGGGTYSLGGTVSGTGTGRLLVSGGIVNSSGSTTFGGQLAISGGTFNAGGTFTAAGFDMSGGILGGTGTAIITGAGTWTTGAMTGAGVTTFNGALALSGNGLRDITTRSVNFAGTSTWTNSAGGNAGRIRTGSGAVINNSGTWLDQTTLATSIANDFGGAASTFNNTGTYTKSGASTTTISIAFNNTSSGAGTGVVNVNAGTLALSGGGTSNGSFDVAAGATLDFGGGTYSLGGTVSGTGTGRLLVSGGIVNSSGSTTFGGQLAISGGTFNAGGTFTAAGFDMSGGILGGTGTAIITGAGTWTTGAMTGAGVTTFNGALALSGNGLRDITTRSVNFAGTSTWTNSAGGNAGRIRTGSGAVINNSGTWLDQTTLATSIANDFGGAASTFNNTGTYTKSGASTTTISIAFNNTSSGAGTGVVNVNAGTLALSGGGTSNGTFQGAGTLEFGGGTYNLQAASSIGTSNVTFSAGTANVGGSYSVSGTTTVSGGTANFTGTVANVGGALVVSSGEANFNNSAGVQFTSLNLSGGQIGGAQTVTVSGATTWTNGTMTDTGTTTLNGATALSGNGLHDLTGGRTLNTTATTTWTNSAGGSAGRIRTGSGAVINNSGTWLDQTTVDTSISNDFGGAASTFNNTGTYTKSGASTTTISIAFNNTRSGAGTGVVNVNAGTLALSGGGTSNGTFQGAGTLEFGGGTYNLQAASSIGTSNVTFSAGTTNVGGSYSVSGTTTVSGGTANFTGTVANVGGALVVSSGEANFNNSAGVQFTSLNLSGGQIGGAQTVTVSGATTWTNGTMTDTGTTTLNGATALSGNGVHDLTGGRTLNTTATTTWTNSAGGNAGRIRTGSGAVINNSGTWLDQTTVDTSISNDFGGAASTFNNTGTYTKSGASATTFSIGFNNTGSVIASGGLLTATSGITGASGTVQVNAGGSLAIGANSTAGTLIHNGNTAGSLALNANITVSSDYQNANFGVGNSFNHRANVSGSGQILAAGANPGTAQTLSGDIAPTPTTGNAVMNFGNVQVGQQATLNYRIGNANPDGPNLIGAIQTSVNGGNITDARLSGAGVTASNWSAVQGGTTGDLAVTFNATNAGALVGQQVHIRNNFDNTNSQNLTFALAGAAFNLAAGSTTPSPVTFANARVGDARTQQLTVTNTAPPGAFTEGLNASFGANTGNVSNNGGSVSLLPGGASNSTNMSATLNTGAAGARSGTVTVDYVSDGTGTSGLGTTPVGSQVINVSGNVYQLAAGTLNSAALNFGTVQVGQAVSQTLSITNSAVGPLGFVEDLNARFGAASGTGAGAIGGTGQVTGLLAGGNNASNMVVSVNTSTAQTISGSIAVDFFSAGAVNGVSNGLAELGVGSVAHGVSGLIQAGGQVVNQANPVINTPQPINLGNVRIDAASPTAFVSVTNQATTPPQAALNASIATASPGVITATGAFNLLDPGQTNASALQVGMVTTSAGAKNGTATISLVSDASNIGNCAPNCQLSLASQNVTVTGNVFRLATGDATPAPLNLGNFRLTTPSLSGNLAVTNTAAADGSSEQLGIQSVTPSSALFTASNTLGAARVNAQATANNAVSVGLGTGLSAGLNTGSVAIQYLSDGTASGTGAPINSNLQNVTVNATGYNLAVGAATPTPVAIANQRVGGTGSQALTVANTAPAGLFSEALNASFSGATGTATNNAGSFANLAAGASNNTAMSVGVNTATAGAKSGTVTLAYQSDGTGPNGNSGLAAIAAGAQVVNVSGNVYQLAAGTLNSAALNFGTVQVGQAVSQTLSITNSAVGPLGFVEDLNARFGAASGTGAGAIGGTGQVTGLLAGGNNASNMVVSVNTSTAQTISGSIAVDFFSAGAVNGVSNGLGELGVGSVAHGVSGLIQAGGQVVNQANPVINTPQPINLGNVRINAASPTALVSVTNQATTAPQAALNASISGTPPITATGSFNLLAPGATNNNSLQVGMQTNVAGAVNGTATISLVSDASNIGNCAPNCQLNLASQNVNVQGAVYRLANPTVGPSPLALAGRVGDTVTSNVTVTNSSPDQFTEGLNASISTASAGFSASGSVTNLAAQASNSTALQVALNTGAAGTFAGSATVALASNGTLTNAPDVNLPNQTVNLEGKVYTAAAATLVPTTVNFGIVHKGDVVAAQNVAVTNSAPVTALNDVLRGSFGGAAGPFGASGNLGAGVVAGASDTSSFNVSLNTAAAGIFASSATATLLSHNEDMADLALADQSVTLLAQVNNFANAALRKNSGEGSLARSGLFYTLDLGQLFDNSGIHSAFLGVLNDVLGPADLLSGEFQLADPQDFVLSGFDPFENLGAGQSRNNLFAGLDTDALSLGSFVDTIVLRARGHNASGYDQSLADITLVLRGTVVEADATVPEPGSIALMALGLLALMRLRRLPRRATL